MPPIHTVNRRIVLNARPVGLQPPKASVLKNSPFPFPLPGRYSCGLFFSRLPLHTRRMSDTPSYAAPVAVGDVMAGASASCAQDLAESYGPYMTQHVSILAEILAAILLSGGPAFFPQLSNSDQTHSALRRSIEKRMRVQAHPVSSRTQRKQRLCQEGLHGRSVGRIANDCCVDRARKKETRDEHHCNRPAGVVACWRTAHLATQR